MTGIMVTLQPLLLLSKPFCFSYIHWTKQHDPKLAELCGKENTEQILHNFKPCQLCGIVSKRTFATKLSNFGKLIYISQSYPKMYKKSIN